MIKHHTRVIKYILLSVFIVNCSASNQTHVKAADLLQKIKAGKAPVIYDVRSQSEYRSGHVPGAIHLPFWRAYPPEDLDSKIPVVVYCEHGPRAGLAKLSLSWSGVENIRYLKGHMVSWKKAGLPMEKEDR